MNPAVLFCSLLFSSVCLAQNPGRLVAWGTDPQPSLPTPDSVIAVASGIIQSHCILTDGSIYRWGYQVYGALPTPNSGFTAVSSKYSHALALRSNGSVSGWGENLMGETGSPSPNTGFVAVSAGSHFSLALRSNGSVLAWGLNTSGVCNVPAPNSGFVAISASVGSYFCMGLKGNGSIVGWGGGGSGILTVPEPNSGFIAVGAGYEHVVGLKEDGSLVAWGSNTYGQLDLPEPNTGFIAISVGMFHSLAMRADSSLVGWGSNAGGICDPPEPNGQFLAFAAGGGGSIATRRLVQGHGVLQPDSLDLGVLLVGTSLSGEFTLENVGSGTLSGTAEPDCPAFVVTQPVFSLEPGESRTFLLHFLPDSPAHYRCEIDLGPDSPTMICIASSYGVDLLSGPESDCGTIENLGDQPGAESGFLVDWNAGLIGLEVQPDPLPSHEMLISLRLDGQSVWNGPATAHWTAVSALDTLASWIDPELRVHFEVSRYEQVWNGNGAQCEWELAHVGLPSHESPHNLELAPPAPNPFNPTTTLAYTLPAGGFVRLELYNIHGERVRELVARTLPAGRHSVLVEGNMLASGLYIARLQTATEARTTRLLLLK